MNSSTFATLEKVRADFNNPIVIVKFKNHGQWKTLREMFGGPEPYGWLTACNMELSLGNVSTFEVVLTMPRVEGLDMLSEFVKGKRSVSLGDDAVSVVFGYVPHYHSCEFTGTLNEFPDIQMGEQVTLTLKCFGVQRLLFADNTKTEYTDKSYFEIVKSILDEKKIEIKFAKNFAELANKMKKSKDMKSPIMYMTKNAMDTLSGMPRNKSDSISKGENSWSFIHKLFNHAGVIYIECGILVGAFELGEPSNGEPVANFVYFGKFDFSQRMIPFEEINIDFLPTAFMGSGSVVKALIFDETKPGAGSLPDIKNNLDGKGVSPGTQDVLSLEKKVDNPVKDASKSAASDIVATAAKFFRYDADAKTFSIGRTNDNQMASVKCTLSTIGIPDIFPGEIVTTDIGRDGLKWNWQIKKVHHQWSGGYKCDFELMVGGNPFTVANDKQINDISNTDKIQPDSSIEVV